ncbi:MAG: hypothetical protein AVDCRST_MAG93-3241 [uncultured Chloroflexia bacterium]|uniref:Peptidase M28 domain-containing protein n=1 Tax=uncultured Chloroflexia bacterium TaxID=1672391 RepID=A0A6J4JLQ8_9CHLR|nr:MAG: hypothetical protein AVDCRST_MAG93-3241 [uncultured Chloroflexia bacterium]
MARTPVVDRRTLLVAGSAWLLVSGSPLQAAGTTGERLFADVNRYAGFGQHRTGTTADVATSRWIERRLASSGMKVELRPFDIRLFEPTKCRVELEGERIVETFPLWPPVVTPKGGLAARLAAAGQPGHLAVVRLPYAPNASLLTPGYAEPIAAAVAAGAAAVIGITEGPTGEIIALNAVPDRFDWSVPVALAAGKDGPSLVMGAERAQSATLRQEGRFRHGAAYNIVASRRGIGRTIVVSTPTSGWFSCAGERGAGVALFLALAHWAATTIHSPLVFLATSGHEIEGRGSEAVLDALPRPADIAGWLHLGANLAGADVTVRGERLHRHDRPFPQRGIRTSPSLLPMVARAFAGVQGYGSPQPVTRNSAVGDVAHYLDAGYEPIVGMVAAHPLHHTRLDLPQYATAPDLLAQLLTPLKRVLVAMAAQERPL